MDECEHLLHHGTTSEVVRKADKILAQAQQYVRSEQDTTPVVTSSMKVDFSHEEDLLDMVDSLGELLVGEFFFKNVYMQEQVEQEYIISCSLLKALVQSCYVHSTSIFYYQVAMGIAHIVYFPFLISHTHACLIYRFTGQPNLYVCSSRSS